MRKNLLIGIFALLLITILFYFVMTFPPPSSTNLRQCYSQIENKLEEMKTKLEIVVTQKNQQTIDFEFGGCFEPNHEDISIEHVTKRDICTDYCGAKDVCDLLTYQYTGRNAFSIRKCLDISPDTIFALNTNDNCPKEGGMSLIDFRKEIKQGTYLLINNTKPADDYLTICAYLKNEN